MCKEFNRVYREGDAAGRYRQVWIDIRVVACGAEFVLFSILNGYYVNLETAFSTRLNNPFLVLRQQWHIEHVFTVIMPLQYVRLVLLQHVVVVIVLTDW